MVLMRVRWFTQPICATAQRTCMFFGPSMSQVLEATNQQDCSTGQRGAKFDLNTAHRKIVWDAVEALVQRGLTSDVAIDRIYSECGGPNTKVNDVIKELKHFRSIGNAALHMHVV